MAQPPLFFILLTAMGLGWLVWEIKYVRFHVRFLLTAIKACPDKKNIGARLRWYRKVLVVTVRLYCLRGPHDKEKKRGGGDL